MANKITYELEINGVKKSAADLTELNNILAETKAEIADKSVGLFGGDAGQISKGFSTLKSGLSVAANGFKTLRGAILSTGIGALLIAFGALMAYFTQSNEGAKILKQATAGLGAVMKVLTDTVATLGKWLVSAFTNPKKALKDLGDFLKGQLMNRLNAVGDVLQGIINLDFKKIGEGMLQFSTGVEDAAGKAGAFASKLADAAMKAAELEAATQKLHTATREWGVQQTELKGQLELLRKTAEDVSVSTNERIANLQKAAAIEQQITGKNISLAQEELRLIKEKISLGDASEEDLDARADAEKKLMELQAQSIGLKQEIKNKESALINEQKAKDEAAAQKRKELLQKRNDFEVGLEEQRINNMADGLQKELALIDFAHKQELAETKAAILELGLTKAQAKIKLAEAEKLLDQKFALEKSNAETENNKKLAEKALQGSTTALEQQAVVEKLLLIKKLQDKAITEEEYQRQSELMELTHLERKAEMLEQLGLDSNQVELEIAEKKVEINANAQERITEKAKEEAEKQKEILEKQFATAQEIINTFSAAVTEVKAIETANIDQASQDQLNILKKKTDAELANAGKNEDAKNAIREKAKAEEERIAQEAAEQKKQIQKKYADIEFAIQAAQIVANTAQAISKAVAASPLTGGLPFSAFAGVIGALQLSSALQQRNMVKTMARGGMVDGPSHANGGVKYAVGGQVVELEGGEGVINKRSMAMPGIRAMASALNQAGGGVRFDFGGITPSTSFSSPEREVASPGKDMRVYVLESDITDTQKKAGRIVSRSTVG